jgi:NADH:ubiquinone oxidoreductase subunit 6 (subunit J)
LPIVFLVVYVGAVAVLFLFVLMMLNIKLAELLDEYTNILPIAMFFSFICVYQLLFLTRFEFEFFENLNVTPLVYLNEFVNASLIKLNFLALNYSLTNIRMIGFALFSNFLCHFILASFVLLLAMIGTIALTLQKRFVTKTQNVYKQILQNYNVTVSSIV